MKYCQQCGNKLNSDSVFCDKCGTQVADIEKVATMFCANCGTKIPATSNYCANCGFSTNSSNSSNQASVLKDIAYNESKDPDPITSFALIFRDTFKVSKRLGRADYWWARLTTLVIGSSLSICWIALLSQFSGYDLPSSNIRWLAFLLIGLSILFAVWGLIALITADIRRLHDLGYSGALMLLILLPTLGDLIILILCMLPSKQNGNRYIN